MQKFAHIIRHDNSGYRYRYICIYYVCVSLIHITVTYMKHLVIFIKVVNLATASQVHWSLKKVLYSCWKLNTINCSTSDVERPTNILTGFYRLDTKLGNINNPRRGRRLKKKPQSPNWMVCQQNGVNFLCTWGKRLLKV